MMFEMPTIPPPPHSLHGITGITQSVSHEAYLASAGISKSRLDLLARSPFHFFHQRDSGPGTPAMELGKAVHCALLEPDRFRCTYVPVDGRKGSASWNEVEEDSHQIPIKQSDWELCQRMRDAVVRHPVAGVLLADATLFKTEMSAWWDDSDTGVYCKCRADLWLPSSAVLADLKTCQDASPKGFARSIASYRYFVQAAFYSDGFTTLGEEIRDFFFIAVEKEPPHAVGVYELSENILKRGRNEYKRLLNLYLECRQENTWPAYSDYIEVIESLPF